MTETHYEFDIHLTETDIAKQYVHYNHLPEYRPRLDEVISPFFSLIFILPGLLGIYLVYDGLISNGYIFVLAMILVAIPVLVITGMYGNREMMNEERCMKLAHSTLHKNPGVYFPSKVTISKHEIIDTNINSETHFKWTGIKKIYNMPEAVYIYTNAHIVFVIPHRYFKDEEHKANFMKDINGFHHDAFTPQNPKL